MDDVRRCGAPTLSLMHNLLCQNTVSTADHLWRYKLQRQCGGDDAGLSALNNLTLAQGIFSVRRTWINGQSRRVGWQVRRTSSGFDPVGQKIKVATMNGQKTSLTVIGVLTEQGGSMFNSADSNIFIPSRWRRPSWPMHATPTAI
jgi:hypothetical protein